jgi:hypothetical protein
MIISKNADAFFEDLMAFFSLKSDDFRDSPVSSLMRFNIRKKIIHF